MKENVNEFPNSIFMLKLAENWPNYSHMKIGSHFDYFRHLEIWLMLSSKIL
jgi:hypothetical protein